MLGRWKTSLCRADGSLDPRSHKHCKAASSYIPWTFNTLMLLLRLSFISNKSCHCWSLSYMLSNTLKLSCLAITLLYPAGWIVQKARGHRKLLSASDHCPRSHSSVLTSVQLTFQTILGHVRSWVQLISDFCVSSIDPGLGVHALIAMKVWFALVCAAGSCRIRVGPSCTRLGLDQ